MGKLNEKMFFLSVFININQTDFFAIKMPVFLTLSLNQNDLNQRQLIYLLIDMD